MEIVQQVLAGKVNKDLVAKLRGRGVGLCGMDGQMLRCTELDPQLGHVGEIIHVDPTLIENLLNGGYIPVIATVGMDDLGRPTTSTPTPLPPRSPLRSRPKSSSP